MTAKIIPTLSYHDAHAAIAWLEEAFGFQRHLVAPDAEGGVAHAQLKLGPAMIMLNTARKDGFGEIMQPPASADAPVTQALYVVIDDVDAHHAAAEKAGATVIMPPEDQFYGGRVYTCRDLEGNLWSFGSYDPWSEAAK